MAVFIQVSYTYCITLRDKIFQGGPNISETYIPRGPNIMGAQIIRYSPHWTGALHAFPGAISTVVDLQGQQKVLWENRPVGVSQ